MMLLVCPSAARAQTFYVDGSSPACSPTGPGTLDAPYCTLSAALAAHHAPGDLILVRPGVYRETVRVPASGAQGAPIVIRAQGAPVLVDGADDYAAPAQWAPYAGDVWLASSVTWYPRQVFADSARLDSSSASPATLSRRTFRFVAGEGLYVNAGGGSPAAHGTMVGRRAYGFYVSGRSWVTIDGFDVTRCDDRGIQLTNRASDIEILRNRVGFSGRFGIQAIGCARVHIASNVCADNGDHGISLTAGTTGSTLEDNECCRNVFRPTREANGIYLFGCPANLIRRNRLHHNQDTGLQIQSGSDNNVCLENTSWSNGDHGYDHLGSSGTVHIGDVAWGNYRDGFSFEGNAPNDQLFNCIAVDNGLTTAEADLWVDAASSVGLQSDYNIFWNSTARPPFKYAGFYFYGTIAEFSAASHTDQHSIQADPRFVDPANGEFQVAAGSPAIDSGDSDLPGWPPTDAAGSERMDDWATPNSGVGPIPYADRGAFEYVPAPRPTVTAVLSVSPASGIAPLTVTLDASGSWDSVGGPLTYGFDFGDGSIAGPGSAAVVTHTYRTSGSWPARVTVANGVGNRDSAQAAVSVRRSNAPPQATIDTPNGYRIVILQGQRINFTGTGTDPDGDLPLSYRWSFGGGAPDQAAEDPGPVRFDTPGSFTVTFTVTDRLGASDPTPDRRWVQVIRSGGPAGSTPVAGALGSGPLGAIVSPDPVPNGGVLRFVTERPGPLRVAIYDIAGRQVRCLADERDAPAGIHEYPLDARDAGGVRLRTGLYFYRIDAIEDVARGRFVSVQ
jgi:hypothetical protein